MLKKKFLPLCVFILATHMSLCAKASVLSSMDKLIYKAAFAASDKLDFQYAYKIAEKASNPLPAKILLWQHLLNSKHKNSFEEITTFIKKNPEWPRQHRLKINAEASITKDIPAYKVIIWFRNNPPVSAEGMYHYASALIRNKQITEAKKIIKKAWIEFNFTKSLERSFLKKFRKYLSRNDHHKRLDRLLWDHRATAAIRLFRYISSSQKKLATARIRLIRRSRNVDAAIRAVPKSMKKDSGLVFERIRWRRRKKRYDEAIELMLKAGKIRKRPDIWWKERHILARHLIETKEFTKAYAIASRHGLSKKDESYPEAEWFSGWLCLQMSKKGKYSSQALKHFSSMYKIVSTPVSRARGAYWSARAAEFSSPAIAKQWYQNAAIYTTAIYGQLASAKLDETRAWLLPEDPVVPPRILSKMQNHEFSKIMKVLTELEQEEEIKYFAIRLFEHAETPVQMEAVAQILKNYIKRPSLTVKISRKARMKGTSLIGSGYPVVSKKLLPDSFTGLEKALVLSVIRQESNFDVKAKSPAGARGLMQLMPYTAKRISRWIKEPYSKSKLTKKPEYNVLLGYTYLKRLVEAFDGSYILGTAAYNAGPGAVRRWLKDYGDPRDKNIDPIDWIESIPYSETRNYVQRILENVQVYRRILGENRLAFSLKDDLKRSNRKFRQDDYPKIILR